MRLRGALAALAAAGLLAGCSSSSSSTSHSATTKSTPIAPVTTSTAQAAADAYVAAVNSLCDALLTKVLAVMNGGHSDVYPVAEYFKELPAHQALLVQFDKDLAKLVVPPSAASQHAALAAYVQFADKIDSARLAAARKGQAAFDTEIRAENTEFLNDPIAAARDAAGFDSSCNAR